MSKPIERHKSEENEWKWIKAANYFSTNWIYLITTKKTLTQMHQSFFQFPFLIQYVIQIKCYLIASRIARATIIKLV